MTVFKRFARTYNAKLHQNKMCHKYTVSFEKETSKACWAIRWTNYKQKIPYEEQEN